MKNNYLSLLHLLDLYKYKSCEDKIYKFILTCDMPLHTKRVGLDYYFINKQYSLREVGKIYNVTPERIRQIVSKFVRTLMHPSRMEYLKAQLDEEYGKLIAERDNLEKRLNAINMELRGYSSLEKDISGNSPIDRLEFSVRTAKCLQNAGIDTIKELSEKTEWELLCLRNFGRKSLREVREVLESIGLTLL